MEAEEGHSREETTKAKAQRRWGQRANSIESQHRNLSHRVTLCGAIRSLKSEEGHWIFCLEDSLAVVGRTGHVRLVACSPVVTTVETRQKVGGIRNLGWTGWS